MNGVPLAIDAPSVAETLHDAGYATALIGKAHFEPFMDPFGLYAENALANLGIRRSNRTGSTDVAACTVVSTIWSSRRTA